MRALALVIEVAIALLVLYGVFRGIAALAGGHDHPPAITAGGRWRMRHYANAGHTVVAVARADRGGAVLEEHVVARIPDTDPDWSRRFLAAKQEAEERAFHLNADSA